MSDEPIDQIYARQHSLTVTPPDHVVIVGCGGVGTWAAIFLALAGTKNLVLIDSDLVEIHNLNRTLFRPYHVGMRKVDALHELLLDIRPTLTVETYPMRSDNIPDMIRNQWTSHVVLDCRDEISPLEGYAETPVNGGYDGRRITLSVNPRLNDIFADSQFVQYRITPSYVVPAALIGLFMANHLCNGTGNHVHDPSQEWVMNLDLTKLNEILLQGSNGVIYGV